MNPMLAVHIENAMKLSRIDENVKQIMSNRTIPRGILTLRTFIQRMKKKTRSQRCIRKNFKRRFNKK